MPDETNRAWRNLWFHTGDLGFIDDDGYVHFVERAVERIRRKGENISAFEVESAALLHESVVEAVAVGVASGFESDEEVKLVVVARPGLEPKPEALLIFLAEKLPHYMVPRYIQFIEALPRSTTGKVQRNSLKISSETPVWDRRAAGIELRRLLDSMNG